jgi:hypothetical protein
VETISYIRTGTEGEWATWEISSAVRGGGRVERGRTSSSQSWVRIWMGWEARYHCRAWIDPLASGLDCRACMHLRNLLDLASGFLREQMRCFHDLLRQKPISLFILLGWSSISMASLTMRSMCWVSGEDGVLPVMLLGI